MWEASGVPLSNRNIIQATYVMVNALVATMLKKKKVKSSEINF